MLNQAVALHQAGRYDEADAAYRKLLKGQPRHFDALRLLGQLVLARGDWGQAAQILSEALKLNAEFAPAWNHFGLALHELGQFDQALSAYDRAIALAPDQADAFCNRGNLLLDHGQAEDALKNYDRAIAIKPDLVEAIVNRGNALQELKRPIEALAAYERAIALNPSHGDAFFNRGSVLQQFSRFREALSCYDRALGLNPAHIQAWGNRGITLQELERYDESLKSYERAIALNPSYAPAYFNRGIVLEKLKRHGDAVASYNQALALDPNSAETYNNLGNALRVLRRAGEALPVYERALALKPDYAEAITNRGSALFELKRYNDALASFATSLALKPDFPETLYNRGNCYMEMQRYALAIPDLEAVMRLDADYDYARGMLMHTKAHCCDWRDYDVELETIETGLRAGERIVTPFPFQAMSQSPGDLRACSEIFAKDVYPEQAEPLWKGERYKHSKIRIGYMAGEFREQATSYLTVGLFEHHDKSRFEIYALDNGVNDSGPTRKRLEAAFDGFIDIGKLSDAEAAALIRAREIDILVDLNGYFGLERTGVFAHRPAPIQVNYLGFPATLGAPYLDYIIADKIVVPEDEAEHYVEKLVWLPDSYQSNDDKRLIGDKTPTRAECGLPEDGFVFCSFNNSYKFTPDMFDVWMRILAKVPKSVLWVLESNDALIPNLRKEAEARGVSGDRIHFAPFVKLAEHLARQRLGDLFLDSLPYNAHTTASDALWAGLPLITCKGTAFPGRVAASLLSAMGLPELITENFPDYEELAVRLATNPQELAAIRAKLAANRLTQPLFDTARFTRHIESAFATIYDAHQAGIPPQAFAVKAIG